MVIRAGIAGPSRLDVALLKGEKGARVRLPQVRPAASWCKCRRNPRPLQSPARYRRVPFRACLLPVPPAAGNQPASGRGTGFTRAGPEGHRGRYFRHVPFRAGLLPRTPAAGNQPASGRGTASPAQEWISPWPVEASARPSAIRSRWARDGHMAAEPCTIRGRSILFAEKPGMIISQVEDLFAPPPGRDAGLTGFLFLSARPHLARPLHSRSSHHFRNVGPSCLTAGALYFGPRNPGESGWASCSRVGIGAHYERSGETALRHPWR